jgi:Putative beta-barrel porin-2, OmpL-like. bbp2
MRKPILPLSLTAALAVPALAVAQQTAPTLDKVLEASGISLSGYVDTAYSHANRDIEGGFSTRVLDSQNNSFVLHQVGVQIAKQPKEGFGGLLNVTTGKDAGVIHSSPSNEQTYDLTQGYLQYAGGPLTVIGGKFTTLHGTEVIWSPSNANFSRSILFGAVPFTHTGVRATYAISDTLSVIAGLNNGWDQLVDSNKGKTLELGATSNPIKPLTLAASYYGGQEFSGVTLMNGRRDSFNIVGSYAITEPFSIGLEFLNVKQKDAVFDGSGGTKDMKYDGFAAYVSYLFMPKIKGTLRAESFNDKDGFHFGNGSMKYKEYTLTVAYLAADSFELRGEVRNDKADNPVFNDGGSLSDSLTTFAVQALYKF